MRSKQQPGEQPATGAHRANQRVNLFVSKTSVIATITSCQLWTNASKQYQTTESRTVMLGNIRLG